MRGALPDHEIKECLRAGFIRGTDVSYIQAGSLDLALGDSIFRVDGVFAPRSGESLEESLRARESFPHDFSSPLEVGTTYYVPLREEYNLHEGIYGYINPKSTTGRHFLGAQLIADGICGYDTIPRGFCGSTALLLTPQSHPVIVNPGLAVSQLRLFDADTRYDATQLAFALKTHKILMRDGSPVSLDDAIPPVEGGRLRLTLDLSGNEQGVVGYRARSLGKAIRMDCKGQYESGCFFEPILRSSLNNGELCIRRGELVLVFTREWVRIPPHLAAEVRLMDPRSGSFVAHGAGFVDAGYGWNETGLPITLEIAGVRENIILYHGRRICLLSLEELRSPAEKPYAGNYATARLLPKQFKQTA